VRAERARLYALAFDNWVAQTVRLQDVAQRLKIAGRDVCAPDVSPVLGAVGVRLDDVPDVLKPLAVERFGEGKGRHVIAVFADTPADRAGLEIGDTLIAVDESRERDRLRVEIDRSGAHSTLEMEVVPGCADPIELIDLEEVNAYADGRSISVTTALMRTFSDDAMLAQIVGHELGHHIYGHNRFQRGLFRSRRREALADYVGVYLAAIAGYPIATDTEKLLELQQDIQYFGARNDHPTTASRDLALRKTLEEIRQKQARGEPILLVSP